MKMGKESEQNILQQLFDAYIEIKVEESIKEQNLKRSKRIEEKIDKCNSETENLVGKI
jgi:ubiquitin